MSTWKLGCVWVGGTAATPLDPGSLQGSCALCPVRSQDPTKILPHILAYLIDLAIIRGFIIVIHLIHVLHVLIILRVLFTVFIIIFIFLFLIIIVLRQERVYWVSRPAWTGSQAAHLEPLSGANE